MSVSSRRAFTLIELLVVIAIIAILAVVVVLTLNPAELLRQSRDANRVSDMATITNALNLYTTDQSGASTFSLGIASDTYPSTSDPSATSTLGDQCQGLGMMPLNTSTGQSWQCAASSYSRDVNGTGWIPVNLSKISAGSPIGSLPVDPTNQTSTGLFYGYNTNGSQFEVTANLESQKYKSQYGNSPQTSYFPEVISGGTPTVSALYNPSGLVGYWPMDEGTGTTSYDESGNGNNGGWQGTQAGTNGYYSGGKVGSHAGYFNGSNDYVQTTSSIAFGSSGTIIAWVDPAPGSMPPSSYPYIAGYYSTGNEPELNIEAGTGDPYLQFDGNSGASSVGLTSSAWYQVAGTYAQSGSNTVFTLYVNGVQTGSSSPVVTVTSGNAPFVIDKWDELPGEIDDVRVYNRALSAAEIYSLYEADK